MIELFNWFLHLMWLFNSFYSNGKCETKEHPYYKGLYTPGVVNYEVVVPQRVDDEGKFISNLIPHHYNKRSTKESDSIFYKLPIAGEECVIQLTPNLRLTSPGAVIEIHRKTNKSSNKNDTLGGMFEHLQLNRLKNADCHYLGIIRGISSSKVALSTCFGLAGFIQTKNGTYTIEPLAEYEISSEEEHPHILYKNEEENHNWTVCNIRGTDSSKINF